MYLERLRTQALECLEGFPMYAQHAIGVLAPSLHRESTDSDTCT